LVAERRVVQRSVALLVRQLNVGPHADGHHRAGCCGGDGARLTRGRGGSLPVAGKEESHDVQVALVTGDLEDGLACQISNCKKKHCRKLKGSIS
jgi:hypothetical protein